MIDRISTCPEDLSKLDELIAENDITDDGFDYSSVVVNKPWGYEYLLYENGLVAIWILCLNEGAETSMHCHPNKITSLAVLEGEVTCSSLQAKYRKKAGDCLFIDKKVFHQSTATGTGHTFLMEIESPVNKRDLVRLKDRYGRKGQGYEKSDKHSRNTQNYNYLSLSAPAVHHNQKKRFDQCSITLRRISSVDELKSSQEMADDNSVFVLKGRLQNPSGQDVPIGEVRSYGELVAENYRVVEDIEILVVKRSDQIVKISEYVIKTLKDHGVSEVFVVPGAANVHLLDAMGRDEKLGYTVVQTENNGALAAEAYSKACGELGVLVVSSGASSTDCLGGVARCWVDSTPLLVISGQGRTDQDDDFKVRQLGNKSINIVEIVKPITKYAVKVSDPRKIREALATAMQTATSGRPGPVWVDIPIDVLGMTFDERQIQLAPPVVNQRPAESDLRSKVAQVRDLLSKSRRPVLLLGNGIRLAKATERLGALLELLKIPVLVSRRALDLIPDDHPLYFGRPGSFGQRRSNFIIQNCDLMISIGSRLSVPLVGRNTKAFARDATKVVVDIDPQELGKPTLDIDLPIASDALDFINCLLDELAGEEVSPQPWLDRCRAWTREFPPMEANYQHGQFINPHLFIHALSSQLIDDDLVVIDGGSILHTAVQSFVVKNRQRIITSTGLELAGFAIPAAVGAGIAAKKRRVVCLCEERGLQIKIAELQTIRDLGIDVKFFVLSNEAHSNLRRIQQDHFGGRYVGTDRKELLGDTTVGQDLTAIFSLPVQRLQNAADMNQVIGDVLAGQGSSICRVAIDSDQYLVPRTGFDVKDDGKWVAKPLEDMYPFLSREVLERNMIVGVLDKG